MGVIVHYVLDSYQIITILNNNITINFTQSIILKGRPKKV